MVPWTGRYEGKNRLWFHRFKIYFFLGWESQWNVRSPWWKVSLAEHSLSVTIGLLICVLTASSFIYCHHLNCSGCLQHGIIRLSLDELGKMSKEAVMTCFRYIIIRAFAWRQWWQPRKTCIMITGTLADNRTQDLPNTKQECYTPDVRWRACVRM